MTTDLFKNTNEGDKPELDDNVSYKEQLVGEGKKFADEEALARGKFEADQFIAQLQKENDEMRSELTTRLSLEEFWEKTKQTQENTGDSDPNLKGDDNQDGQRDAPPSKEELAEIARQVLNEETQKSKTEQNVQYVRDELTKVWGNEFPQRLQEKAKELGSSVEFLGTMAETQPKAFLALMVGETASSQRPPPNEHLPPRTSVTRVAPTGGTKNNAYYSKMRKENPAQYHSVSTQLEMFEAAKAMGPDFYKS